MVACNGIIVLGALYGGLQRLPVCVWRRNQFLERRTNTSLDIQYTGNVEAALYHSI